MSKHPEGPNGHSFDSEHSSRESEPRRGRRKRRWSFIAAALATLLAAVVTVSLSAGPASAQTIEADGTDTEANSDDNSTDSHDCDHGPKGRRGAMTDTLAEVLGIDAEELRTERKAGSTIAEIAEANDVAVADVIDALVAAAQERAAEHDKQVDADELTEKFTALVNGEKRDRSDHEVRRGLRGRWHGRGAATG